jgi:hypothetical protein
MSFDENRKKVVTGLLAAATDFGAETAMLEVSGMPLALLATGKAGRPTGFDGWMNETEIRHGLPKQDASGRVADISAVEVESNAAHQFLQIILAQTGVRAGGATCAAVEAFADAAKDGISILGGRHRVQLEDLWIENPRSFLVPAQCPGTFVIVLETALLTA